MSKSMGNARQPQNTKNLDKSSELDLNASSKTHWACKTGEELLGVSFLFGFRLLLCVSYQIVISFGERLLCFNENLEEYWQKEKVNFGVNFS